jgi:hypothetical protein
VVRSSEDVDDWLVDESTIVGVVSVLVFVDV